MKTKSAIKLFATAILATAAIGAADVVNTAQKVFASEVTQVPNKNNVGTRTTFETDPVFKNFEEGEKYLDNYVKPTIENSRYGYYTASVVPDGLGGNYLVEGFIDSHSEDAEVIKGNKETAQKIVDNAGKDLSRTTPTTPTTPTTDDEPVEIPAVSVEPSAPTAPSVTPSETPSAPTTPAAPSVNPSETPAAPAVPSETPTTPTVPANNSETPVTPSVDPSETPASPAATVTPTAPTVDQNVPAVSNSQSNASTAPTVTGEDNSKPTPLQNSDAKPAQSIVALAGGKKEDEKPSKSEDPKQSNTVKKDESKTESSKKSESSEPVKKGEDKLKELPNTGEGSSNLGIVGLMIFSVLAGFFGFKKRNG